MWWPSGSCQGCQREAETRAQPVPVHPDQSDRVQNEVLEAMVECLTMPCDWRCHSSTVVQAAAVSASNNRSVYAFPGKNIPCATSGSGWPSAGTAPGYRKNDRHPDTVPAVAAAGSSAFQSAAAGGIPRIGSLPIL